MAAKKVPIGIDNFEKLRQENFYYVDKSGLTGELLKSTGTKVTVITCPRRFGKSLTSVITTKFFAMVFPFSRSVVW